jgi:hypothetical protein
VGAAVDQGSDALVERAAQPVDEYLHLGPRPDATLARRLARGCLLARGGRYGEAATSADIGLSAQLVVDQALA